MKQSRWRFAASMIALAAGTQAFSQGAGSVAWELEGFAQPETVVFDQERGVFYVSNIAGEPLGADGVGYISRVSADGEMLEAEWVTGFDAPKGLEISGDTLFVADLTRLAAIDLTTGEVSGSWDIADAQFTNDIAVDETGRVYVSDMFANRIYVLADGVISVQLEDPALMHPNGLEIDGGSLIVTAWGNDIQNDFTTLEDGHVLSVDLASGAVSAVGPDTPIGNLDGLEKEGEGAWLASDWIAGALYRIMADGNHEMVADFGMGSANFAYLAADKIAVVPLMLEGKIVAIHTE